MPPSLFRDGALIDSLTCAVQYYRTKQKIRQALACVEPGERGAALRHLNTPRAICIRFHQVPQDSDMEGGTMEE